MDFTEYLAAVLPRSLPKVFQYTTDQYVFLPFVEGGNWAELLKTMSSVNISLKLQTLLSEICHSEICHYNFLSKKCDKLLQKLLSVFQQKILVYFIIKL